MDHGWHDELMMNDDGHNLVTDANDGWIFKKRRRRKRRSRDRNG